MPILLISRLPVKRCNNNFYLGLHYALMEASSGHTTVAYTDQTCGTEVIMKLSVQIAFPSHTYVIFIGM